MNEQIVTDAAAAEKRDQAAREVIRTALNENIMVLAGAGAGKTHEMITRMVNLVRRGTPVEQLAAITFTKKAAGEMQGRFFERLQKAAAEAPPKEKTALRRARQKIDRCYIGTIHSFCGRLLRERSLEAGLPPDFTEIDDREELDLRKRAWQSYLGDCTTEKLEALRALGLEPVDLSDFFGDLCQFEDVRLHLPEAPKPDLQPAVQEIIAFMEETEPMIPNRPVSEKGYDICQRTVLKARRFLKYHGLQNDGDHARLIKWFETLASQNKKGDWKGRVTYNRWGSSGTETYEWARQLKNEHLPELISGTLAPVLEAWEGYVYNKAAEFTRPAVTHYREMRLKEGRLTFQDLLTRARDLLRDHSRVRAFFQQRYRYLFVDEFQDTDPIQAEILFYLTDHEHREEKDWTKLTPRPGSLFLVGDGKQSIYRFRRADYETFNLVRQRLEDSASGKIIRLQRSFRTFENLCGYVNHSFPDIFNGHSEPHQAPFQELLRIDSKVDGHDDGRVRRITVPYKKWNSANEIAQEDAARIAAFISAMVRGHDNDVRDEYLRHGLLPEAVGYGDFMILTRNTTRLDIYAEALERLDIPYDLTGGGTFGESEELSILLDMLHAVYDPDNPVPLLSYLRGPLVGLSDENLYAFKQAGGQFHFRSEFPGSLETNTAERFQDAFHALRRADKWFKTLPPSAALERLLDDRGLPAFSAIRENGSSRAGTLLKLLALMEEMEAQGSYWIEIMEELREIADDKSYKIEEMTLEAGARTANDRPTAVQLMNLHKAKGLEAKVVFLADPYNPQGGNHAPRFHVSRVGNKDPFVVLPVTKKNRHNSGRKILYQPCDWADHAATEEQFLEAENTRLLYVAATRAENLLVVSRYRDKDDKIRDGFWGALNPYLEEVPELEICEATPKPPVDGTIDLGIVHQKRADIRKKIARSTFALGTVTDEVAEEGEMFGGTGGHGRSYGTLVHHLFEVVIAGHISLEEASEYLDYVLEEHAAKPAHKEDALRTLEALLRSDVWQQIQTARAEGRPVYTEVPFAGRQNDTIISGQIDLVFQTEAGWRIIDWKTAVAASPDELEALKSHYAPQLAAYKEYWEGISGEAVTGMELWLTERAQRVLLYG